MLNLHVVRLVYTSDHNNIICFSWIAQSDCSIMMIIIVCLTLRISITAIHISITIIEHYACMCVDSLGTLGFNMANGREVYSYREIAPLHFFFAKVQPDRCIILYS